MKKDNILTFTNDETEQYKSDCRSLDEKIAFKTLMEDKYLSELTFQEVRALFIERLIDDCKYIISKENKVKNDPSDVDYRSFKLLKYFMDTACVSVNKYSEIVLAMTSDELKDIPEILSTLGYDKEIYLQFKKLMKEYNIE